MPDPSTIVTIATASIKLLANGLKLSLWDGWSNWPAHDRLGWLAKLLDIGKDGVSAFGELLKPLLPEGSKPETSAHLWSVHVACFGEALAAHWGGNQAMAGRGSKWGHWFAPEWVRQHRNGINAALQFAADVVARTVPSPILWNDWLSTPTASPIYRALWETFTAEGEEPALIPLDGQGAVNAFERAFVQAFREAMARNGNAELRTLMQDQAPRGESLRALLIADMAAWRHQHVFAGVDTSEGIPELPLDKSYVEPTAVVKLNAGKAHKGPVLSIVEELLAVHRVLFVSADFGHGKSLTARTLAWRWAVAYLESSVRPTIDRIFPVHIRCSSDVSGAWDLEPVVRRALKRCAEQMGVSLPINDPALAPPPSQQRAVYLLDGLDEVVLTEQHTKSLLRELLDQRLLVNSLSSSLDLRCCLVWSMSRLQ